MHKIFRYLAIDVFHYVVSDNNKDCFAVALMFFRFQEYFNFCQNTENLTLLNHFFPLVL